MQVPRLSVEKSTFSSELFHYFVNLFGLIETQKLIDSLGKPVKKFTLRVSINRIAREEILEFLEQNNWKVEEHPILKEIICVKTKGPYKIPYYPNAPRIFTDKIAAESVFIGADLFRAGLSQIPVFDKGEIVNILSPKKQIVSVGKTQINSKKGKGKGIAVENIWSKYKTPSIRKLGLYRKGLAYSQSLPAAYVGHVVNPQPREKIIDLCAAPGGKTTSMAILSNNKAKIIAFDRSKNRLAKLNYIIKTEKLKNIQIINADSIEYFNKHTIKADKVVVDPSCTALGIRPKLYEKTNVTDITNAARYQKSFLWAAAKTVRKGGYVIYSTCTLTPEENEEVIAFGVNKLGLELTGTSYELGGKGYAINQGLNIDKMCRFYPHKHDTSGFFIAKLEKK